MADESKESCSFHDMGLDDRLVKVNVIPVVEVNQECLLGSSCRLLVSFSGDRKVELVPAFGNSG